MKHDDLHSSTQFEQAPHTEPKDGSAEKSTNSPASEKKTERRLLQKAKQNMGVLAIVCAIAFLILYTLVNIASLTSIFSAVLSVLTPILLGGALAYLLNPLLKLFERRIFKWIKSKRTLRGVSLLCTYLSALLLVTGFIFLLIPSLWKSVVDLYTQFPTYVTNTANWINGIVSKLSGAMGGAAAINEETLLSAIQGFLFGSGNMLEKIAEYVVQYGMGLIIGIKNAVLAIFISIYILISKERLMAQSKKLVTALFSERGSNRVYRCVSLCHKTFGGFFVGKIIDSLIIGLITLVALLIFRIEYAVLVSTIVCITNVIPVFGPFIGAIPSFFIILIADPVDALIFLVLILLIQQLDGNVIGPKILGNSTGLSSLGVIISIIIMGEYFGVIGMILGVPLFAVIVSLFKGFLDSRLAAKQLPTDTAEYYSGHDIEFEEKHESLLVSISKHLSPNLHKRAQSSHVKRKEKKQSKANLKENKEKKEERENA